MFFVTSPACASRRPSVRLSSRRRLGSCRRSVAVLPAYLPTTIPVVYSSWWRTAVHCPRPTPNASSLKRPTRPRVSPTVVRSSSARKALSSNTRRSRPCHRRPKRKPQTCRRRLPRKLKMVAPKKATPERKLRCSLLDEINRTRIHLNVEKHCPICLDTRNGESCVEYIFENFIFRGDSLDGKVPFTLDS